MIILKKTLGSIVRIVVLTAMAMYAYEAFAQVSEHSVVDEENFQQASAQAGVLDPILSNFYNRHKEEIGGSDHKLFITETAYQNAKQNKSFVMYVESLDSGNNIQYHKITAMNDTKSSVPWVSGVEREYKSDHSKLRNNIIKRRNNKELHYYKLPRKSHGEGNHIMNETSLQSVIYNRHKEEIGGSDHKLLTTDKQQNYVNSNISFSMIVESLGQDGAIRYHKITAMNDTKGSVPWVSGVKIEPKPSNDLKGRLKELVVKSQPSVSNSRDVPSTISDTSKVINQIMLKDAQKNIHVYSKHSDSDDSLLPTTTVPSASKTAPTKYAPKKQRGSYLKPIPGTSEKPSRSNDKKEEEPTVSESDE